MEKIEIKRGDKGKQVKLVQEWLCLHGILVDIDGDKQGGGFGPATEAAVREFQNRHIRTKVDGIVDEITMNALIRPLSDAMAQVAQVAPATNIGLTVCRTAQRHLAMHPREVGGQNMGPWVRAYMDGHEGKEFAWCAGFVCTILKQAFEAHGQKPPFPKTYGCDLLAQMNANQLVRPANGLEAHRFALRPGTIFLIRKTETDWTHTGFVTNFHDNYFNTIEGNSNDEGSREGHELCARTRGYARKDFIPV